MTVTKEEHTYTHTHTKEAVRCSSPCATSQKPPDSKTGPTPQLWGYRPLLHLNPTSAGVTLQFPPPQGHSLQEGTGAPNNILKKGT